jgi:hypothetical protein
MISKRQKISLGVSIAVLLLCSMAALVFARMYYSLAPMVINDSSPDIAVKLTDEERTHIYSLVRSLLFQVSLVLSILAGLWAAFAGVTTWLGAEGRRGFQSMSHKWPNSMMETTRTGTLGSPRVCGSSCVIGPRGLAFER